MSPSIPQPLQPQFPYQVWLAVSLLASDSPLLPAQGFILEPWCPETC